MSSILSDPNEIIWNIESRMYINGSITIVLPWCFFAGARPSYKNNYTHFILYLNILKSGYYDQLFKVDACAALWDLKFWPITGQNMISVLLQISALNIFKFCGELFHQKASFKTGAVPEQFRWHCYSGYMSHIGSGTLPKYLNCTSTVQAQTWSFRHTTTKFRHIFVPEHFRWSTPELF